MREIRRDVAAARERDPAARGVSSLEILLNWPGVHALLAHRVSHALHAGRVPLRPARDGARHPRDHEHRDPSGGSIGQGLFIDHGTGVVVGETAQIGDNVTLYQGVTLGGTGFATGKRHPTVQDNVTIGSGAKLLGPITVGHGAKIGANSVVITDVPPNTTVVGNPGHVVRVDGRKVGGADADWIHLPGPRRRRDPGAVEPHRGARARARRARRRRRPRERRARHARRGPPAASPPRPEPGRRVAIAARRAHAA